MRSSSNVLQCGRRVWLSDPYGRCWTYTLSGKLVRPAYLSGLSVFSTDPLSEQADAGRSCQSLKLEDNGLLILAANRWAQSRGNNFAEKTQASSSAVKEHPANSWMTCRLERGVHIKMYPLEETSVNQPRFVGLNQPCQGVKGFLQFGGDVRETPVDMHIDLFLNLRPSR